MHINVQKKEKGIELGDLVLYKDSFICLVIFEEEETKYSYKLLNLKNCNVMEYCVSLEELNSKKDIKLYAKGNKIALVDA